MNEKIQAQLDEQLSKMNDSRKQTKVVEVADAPLFTAEAAEIGNREFDIVEVNFKDCSAEIVEKSKAPKLTQKVLKEQYKPIKLVEMLFDFKMWTVEVWDGVPLDVDIGRRKVIDSFAERLKTLQEKMDTLKKKDASMKSEAATSLINEKRKLLNERGEAAKRFMISKMIHLPQFSYGGGDGIPLESQHQLLINALWQAFSAVENPTGDAIYQVEITRGVPIEASLLFQKGFDFFPLSNLGKPLIEHTDTEIETLNAIDISQRRISVSSLIRQPKLSYNGKGVKHALPIENISERALQTLHRAYRVVNVPSEQLEQLQRFPEVGDGNGNGQDSSVKPVDRD